MLAVVSLHERENVGGLACRCWMVRRWLVHVQSHSMPTPQQLPDPLQRSISPGGFDSFSLATDFPSLSMLSPHSQHQQQAPSLPRQQLPSYDLASGVAHNARCPHVRIGWRFAITAFLQWLSWSLSPGMTYMREVSH